MSSLIINNNLIINGSEIITASKNIVSDNGVNSYEIYIKVKDGTPGGATVKIVLETLDALEHTWEYLCANIGH